VLREGAAAVELGFAEARTERPTGVRSAASFSWGKEPAQVRRICGRNLDQPLIRDEYGRVLTGREFLAMLRCNCPLESVEFVGEYFS
jgi:hypothetical protein